MNRRRILLCLWWSLGLWSVSGLLLWGAVTSEADAPGKLATFLLALGGMLFLVGVAFPTLLQGLFFHTFFRGLLPAFKDPPVLSFFLDTEPPP